MPNRNFQHYLIDLIDRNKLNKSVIAERANISRVTLHKMLNGEIKEAKLSTFMNLAYALNTHPIELLRRFYTDGHADHPTPSPTAEITPKARRKNKVNDCGFVDHVTYPDNTHVYCGERFTKTWKLVNMGDFDWIGAKLVCMDELPASQPASQPARGMLSV
jgi:DNA-binding Xre family transcriptional regulator